MFMELRQLNKKINLYPSKRNRNAVSKKTGISQQKTGKATSTITVTEEPVPRKNGILFITDFIVGSSSPEKFSCMAVRCLFQLVQVAFSGLVCCPKKR